MSFPEQPGQLFLAETVSLLPDGLRGCYGIYKEGTWVYVGKGYIKERLLAHLRGDNPCISAQGAVYWVYEATGDEDVREKQLIAELEPICNQRMG